jgi:hypothetical protein
LIANLKSAGGGKLGKLLTEEARLAAFNGDWKTSAKLCNEAYATNPPAITRLTLLQIGALAHFERGDFESARFNLSLIESMKAEFPKCVSVFYAELLRLRILAREGAAQAVTVRAQIGAMWKKWLAEPGDIDQLQTLLRVEVDLRRLWGLPHFTFALGSYLVAQSMGENLYAALALIECHVAAPDSQRETVRSLALEAGSTFERVRRIFDELEGKSDPSTSVQGMKDYLLTKTASETAFDERHLHQPSLVIPEYGVVVNLSPSFRVRSISGYAQFAKIFTSLACGPVSKEEFFALVWGNQKYVEHLHDGSIYTALYRLKKICGVRATIRDRKVHLEDALVVVS